MAPVYHPIPTNDPPSQESKYYIDSNVSTGESQQFEAKDRKQKRFKRIRKIHLTFIGLFAIFYMSFLAAKAFFASPMLRGGLRSQCHKSIQRIQGIMGPHYRHMHHGLSKTVSQLPTHYTLPSGDKIPAVALGVWRADPGEVGNAVKAALQTGYRHIDGAWIYGNEAEVGQALKDSGVPRRDIWLTSKLWNSFHDPTDVESTLDETLARLGTDYLDLYLIHWPVAFKKGGKPNEVNLELTENPYPTWQKLEEMVDKGKVRNIGISNFNIRRIQNLTANPLKIKPAINQVELSYWNPQPELLKWSKENGLLLEAYSPLGSQDKVKESLSIPEVKAIAEELGITPAQAYISWQAQRGVVVLPKSVHPARIAENFEVTALPQDAFERMERLAASHKPFRAVDPSKNWGVDIFN